MPQRSRRLDVALEFGLDNVAQRWQRSHYGFPNKFGRDVFVIVAINVSCTCHLLPTDSWMSRFQLLRQAARSFGNDFQASRNGVHALGIILEGGPVEPL